jgi:hypothetical protein
VTRPAKLDDPTIPLDRPAQVLRAVSVDKPSRPAEEAVEPEPIDSALMAELESALQAVLARGPRLQVPAPEEDDTAATDSQPREEAPQPAVRESGEAALTSDALTAQGEPPRTALQASRHDAVEPSPPPQLLLRSAAAPAIPPAFAMELEPPRVDGRAGAEPRRRGLPLRAALCVAGVVGLAGAGGIGLMYAAAPDRDEAPLLAKPVRTETIHASVAADVRPAPAEATSAASTPTGAAAADTPATEFTLLRPVGEGRSTAASVLPAERSPLIQDQPQTGAPGSGEAVKAPDRLVELPAQEAASGEPGETAAEAFVSPAPPPAGGAVGQLPGRDKARPGEETSEVVSPRAADQELVARTGMDEVPASSAAATEEPALSAADGDDVAAPAETAGGGVPTRTAPVMSAVNMRAGPNNEAAVLAVVPAGSEVEVFSCEHWCEVRFAGERGWIYRSFVRGTES